MGVIVPPKTGVKSFGITSTAIIIAYFSLADDRTKSYRLHTSKKHCQKYNCSWEGLHLERRHREASFAQLPAASDIDIILRT
eukprot:scaffold2841_cov31-Attheya_sp.AAC.3